MDAWLYLAGLAVIGAVAWWVSGPLLTPGRSGVALGGGDVERYRLEKERDLAYAAIKEAEFDFQMGKLSTEDYALLRQKYEGRAVAALTALDRLDDRARRP